MIPPYLPPEKRPTDAEGWRSVGRNLAKAAEPVNAAGLRLAWHNHDFEYRPLPDGTRPIDLLLEAAGPTVGYEVDFAWVTRGGGDPLAELRRYGSRMTAIQVKDTHFPVTPTEGGWAATGDGVVDWPTLYPLFATTPADHLVVEHDEPADWRNIARRSIDYLRKLAEESSATARSERWRARQPDAAITCAIGPCKSPGPAESFPPDHGRGRRRTSTSPAHRRSPPGMTRPRPASAARSTARPSRSARSAASRRWRRRSPASRARSTPRMETCRLTIFAADHGIAAEGVSAYPQAVTRQMVQNFLDGGAAANVFAGSVGVELRVVDAGVAGDADRRPAAARPPDRRRHPQRAARAGDDADQRDRALDAGRALGSDGAFDAVAFGEMGIANTSAAALVAHKLAGLPLDLLVGRGTGLDDAGWPTRPRSSPARRPAPRRASTPPPRSPSTAASRSR